MKILELFDAERGGDSETVKSRRFEEVLALMTQVRYATCRRWHVALEVFH